MLKPRNSLLLVGALLGVGACGVTGPTDDQFANTVVTDAAPPDAFFLPPCGNGIDASIDASPIDAPPADAALPFGERHHFVANTIQVPTSSVQSRDLGQNIDGDPNNRPDNAIGGIFSALRQQGIDVQAGNSAAVAAGEILALHMLQTEDVVNATHAWWSVFQGQDQPNPDFSGLGTFSIDPSAPTDSLLEGRIVNGTFTGGPGRARVELQVLFGVPVTLDLIGARITADVTASGCSNAKIGGGLTDAEVHNNLIPALAAGFDQIVASDPGCPASCAAQTRTILNLFDTDHDFHITVTEVADNALIKALFAPDVDLLDENGAFNPRHDGRNDSLSVGFGFTCVGATFAQ